jgi:hypothetical protein
MPNGMGHQDAQDQDEEQAKQEAEALMVLDEASHAKTVLDASSIAC